MSADDRSQQAVPDEGAASPRLGDVLWAHRPAVYSWGQEDCTYPCEWEGPADEHPAHQADAWREACTIHTAEQINALPVGAVVLALWADLTPPCVVVRYIDGWFGFPGLEPLHPLGTGRNGETALLVWHPDWEATS